MAIDLWHQKTRVHGLSYGAICVILYLAVGTNTCVWQTDRRTNGQTERRTDTRRQHTYTALA